MVDLLDMLKCPYDELARTYYGQEGLMTEEDRKDLKHWSDWVADCVSFEVSQGSHNQLQPITETVLDLIFAAQNSFLLAATAMSPSMKTTLHGATGSIGIYSERL